MQSIPGMSIFCVASEMNQPIYKIDRSTRAIRVFHGDLDLTWWKRGVSIYESDVRAVETLIRRTTGLQRVYRRHERSWVVFILSSRHFNAAAVAVRMGFSSPLN